MWPDDVDEILAGDQVVALAYTTPANGVILTPLTNFGLRDREAGTLRAANSSVAAWRKLDRTRTSPKIALAYHTRTHGFGDRPEYVLMQGTASLGDPVEDYPRSLEETWERFGGPVDAGPIWNWWTKVLDHRVEIRLAVERAIVWPDLACQGVPAIHGTLGPGRRRGRGPGDPGTAGARGGGRAEAAGEGQKPAHPPPRGGPPRHEAAERPARLGRRRRVPAGRARRGERRPGGGHGARCTK